MMIHKKMSGHFIFAALVLSIVSVVTCFEEFGIDGKVKTLNRLDKQKYRDCDHVRSTGGYEKSGEYTIFLNTSTPLTVTCLFQLNNTYTSIMQQKYGHESFRRTWTDYVYGFGSVTSGDFWLGLSNMKQLSDLHHNVLTITLQDWTNTIKTIRYNQFALGPYSDRYRLYLGGYVSSQVLADDFFHNNNMQFSTYDAPDLHNCARNQGGGWWYNYCTYTLPTGKYYQGGHYTPYPGTFYDGIYYKDWHGYGYSLKYIRMDLSMY